MTLGLGVGAPLLAVVLFNISLAQAATEPIIKVSHGGVKFKVVRFDDRQTKPFKIIFNVEDEKSAYKFNTDGDVTDVGVGDLMYEVGPTSVTDVSLTDGNRSTGATRRLLTAERNEENGHQPLELSTVDRHRRLPACGDCGDTWGLMCGRGLQSVCDLVDYGSPFVDSAEASISTLCDDFGGACSSFTVDLACELECEDEDEDDDTVVADGACQPNPCNAGTCSVDSAGGHTCSCPDGFGGMNCQTDTSNLARFYIDIMYNGTSTEAEEQLVRSQADRWEEVITHVPCGGTETLPAGALLLVAEHLNIDGVGGWFGYAAPVYVWNDCTGVSLVARMVFDVDDLALMTDTELETLYLHEMGHAIGIGAGWEACSTCLEDNDPEWTCPAAAAVYNDLLGASPGSAANIVEVEGGNGTQCGHWAETTFDTELMTGYAEDDVFTPLSKLTVASLEDIGYIVDSSMADPYTLPALHAEALSLGSSVSTRRERPDVAFETTKYFVDKDGNTVKEKQINASVRF